MSKDKAIVLARHFAADSGRSQVVIVGGDGMHEVWSLVEWNSTEYRNNYVLVIVISPWDVVL